MKDIIKGTPFNVYSTFVDLKIPLEFVLIIPHNW
jgi:hypothetical protein